MVKCVWLRPKSFGFAGSIGTATVEGTLSKDEIRAFAQRYRAPAPLPVELVMRSYLTGVTSTSIWTHYEGGKRTFRVSRPQTRGRA